MKLEPSANAATAGSQTVLRKFDEYTSVIVAQDVDAWRETITDDYFNRRYLFKTDPQELSEGWTLEEDTDAEYAKRIEFYGALEYEQVGDLLVVGDGPWFVTVEQTWSETDSIVWNGSATYTVVERDGVMKVASEYFVGTATQS